MVDVKDIEEVGTATPFGPDTEKAIVSLCFDEPEFFSTVGKQLTYKYFRLAETKFVMAVVEKLIEKHGFVPPRHVVRDYALKHFSTDDDWEPFLEVIDRASSPREVPFIKEELTNWARDAAYGLLYDDEAIAAYESRDYEALQNIFEEAQRISDVSAKGLWFFDEMDRVFDKDMTPSYTCGFSKIDQSIEGGGPSKGEVFCWMAATGVGKSILLPHAGIANMKRGCKVLHVTLELSAVKTQLRYSGAMSDVEIHRRFEAPLKEKMKSKVEYFRKAYGGDLVIYDLPPDETTVDHIYALIHQLRKQKNWNPDVLIIDYLEQLTPRRSADNEYARQKTVTTEIRGLARRENVLIFTATQTNRPDDNKGKGGAPQVSGVNKVAESYGKMMPLDYVVSANQSEEERNNKIKTIRLYIAKNRNGARDVLCTIKVNYTTMKMEQFSANKITKK
mgnify:CR=1 FL=1|tara:strand:- start:73689 stop:75029 length:1341 start_codon:yes stop_codon:yes gene_type:complete